MDNLNLQGLHLVTYEGQAYVVTEPQLETLLLQHLRTGDWGDFARVGHFDNLVELGYCERDLKQARSELNHLRESKRQNIYTLRSQVTHELQQALDSSRDDKWARVAELAARVAELAKVPPGLDDFEGVERPCGERNNRNGKTYSCQLEHEHESNTHMADDHSWCRG